MIAGAAEVPRDIEARVRLRPGEEMLWAGRARQGVLLHSYDVLGLAAVLAGATVGVFQAFILTGGEDVLILLGAVALFSAPLLLGVVAFIARPVVDARKRARIVFVFTSERLVTVDDALVTWHEIRSIKNLTLRVSGAGGTIYLGRVPTVSDVGIFLLGSVKRWLGADDDSDTMPAAFELGPEAREVHVLIQSAREQLRTNPAPPPTTPSAP